MSDMLMCSVNSCKYYCYDGNGNCKLGLKGLDLEVTDDGQGILGKCIDYEETKENKSMLKLCKYGYVYVSEKTGKEYDLLSGESIGVNMTSDICFIIDWDLMELGGNDNVKIVNFFFGSSNFETDLNETENIIKEYVDEYESKQNYNFTTEDIDKFYDGIREDYLEKLEQNKIIAEDNVVKIRYGNRCIEVPITEDNLTELSCSLHNCRENTVGLIWGKEKKEICNSCYSETIRSLWEILNDNHIDGWDGIHFLDWFSETSIPANNGDVSKVNIYFVCGGYFDCSDHYEDICYSTDIEEIIKKCKENKEQENIKYYMIECTEDCALYELV